MKHIAGASGGGENSRWQGCPRHVCFLGRTIHLSELLLKEGKGISVHGQLAGIVPRTHPSPLCVHTHTDTHSAINWHGPRLKYLPGTCKQKAVQEIMINPCLSYLTALFSSLPQYYQVCVVFLSCKACKVHLAVQFSYISRNHNDDFLISWSAERELTIVLIASKCWRYLLNKNVKQFLFSAS